MSAEMRRPAPRAEAFLREHVYRHYRVLRMTTKARRVLAASCSRPSSATSG